MQRDSYEDMDRIGEQPKAQRLEGFNLLLGITELVGCVLIILMGIWLTHFRGGFAWRSDPGHEFNWHPLLMTIGLVFLYANGMLIYRTQRQREKQTLKLIHGGTMLFILGLTAVGQVAVFDSHNLATPPIPNLYSLHSWVGLTSILLFFCQWIAGFVSFYWPGIQSPLRASYMPIHVYFGTAGFVGVIATCLIGLNEKGFFLKGADAYGNFSSEGVFINIIGLFFIIFGGLTVYISTQSRYKRQEIAENIDLIASRQN